MAATAKKRKAKLAAQAAIEPVDFSKLTQAQLQYLPRSLELEYCRRHFAYFLQTYCQIQDNVSLSWVPMKLWPAQREVVDALLTKRQICMLKARQLGFTWICLGYVLWLCIFKPIQTCLLFSQMEEDANELLDMRIRGMAARLPPWMQPGSDRQDRVDRWMMKNGSRIVTKASTGRGGRSFTGTLVMIDEADYIDDLGGLLEAAGPIIPPQTDKGKLILLSTSNKDLPGSMFKKVYKAGKAGENGYHAIFQPWSSRPDQTQEWYDAKKREAIANHSIDSLFQEYPSTDIEALASRSEDKRFPREWLTECYKEMKPLTAVEINQRNQPAIANLKVYVPPRPDKQYVMGSDTSEGIPHRDPSSVIVLERESGEQCASLCGCHEPPVLGGLIDEIGNWYNRAPVMVERNNHGHSVLLWLRDNSRLQRVVGLDGNAGWVQSTKSKTMAMNWMAEALKNKEIIIHDFEDLCELEDIEGISLKAPPSHHDDRAIAFVMAVAANLRAITSGGTPRVESKGFFVGR